MYSLSRTSNRDADARLAREQSAPVISGGRFRRTDTSPSGFVAKASRKCRSRGDQSPGEKSGRYSFSISCMAKEPTFPQELLGSAIPLAIAVGVIVIATDLFYTFWYGVDWIGKWFF